MTPSQIRAELLEQHAGLRSLIGDTRKAAEGVGRGRSAGREELLFRVERLTTALRAHNLREETLLRDVVKNVDAWGPVRVEIMDESHVEEHLELVAALLGTNGASDAEIAGTGVSHVLDRLEAHMAREEEVILAENVLRDDGVAIGAFGG
jgi:hypothetical protein